MRVQRKRVCSERLMAHAVKAYQEHCSQFELVVGDVLQEKVWHQSFDPHEMAPEIQLAPLAPKPIVTVKAPALGSFVVDLKPDEA